METCPVGTEVSRAAALLRAGGLVAFATETVYGLGANALDARAVARVFEAKERPEFDPLIVHVAERGAVDELVTDFPEVARVLVERFWPGPLTLVLPKTDRVPDLVTAGLSTVAVRMPDHPQALELIRTAGCPVAAPSANRFGGLSPTRPEHVVEQLGERIDYVLDGGPCRVGVESTVLSLLDNPPVLLRPGGLPLEEIETAIGPVALPDEKRGPSTAAQPSPGRLPRHYAPHTPLFVVPSPASAADVASDRRLGLVCLVEPPETVRQACAAVEALSPAGDLTEAAANFFAALRRLDTLGLDAIAAERFPEHGLGRALNDRLRRAAHP